MAAAAHFIVQTVAGCMITACQETIPPRDVQGARVGIYGPICKDCEKVAKEGWVTVQT